MAIFFNIKMKVYSSIYIKHTGRHTSLLKGFNICLEPFCCLVPQVHFGWLPTDTGQKQKSAMTRFIEYTVMQVVAENFEHSKG